jgi:hypothetical protein
MFEWLNNWRLLNSMDLLTSVGSATAEVPGKATLHFSAKLFTKACRIQMTR